MRKKLLLMVLGGVLVLPLSGQSVEGASGQVLRRKGVSGGVFVGIPPFVQEFDLQPLGGDIARKHPQIAKRLIGV